MKQFLFCLFIVVNTFYSFSQINITGKVVNDLKQPLLGASIFIKGTLKGTTTDSFGNFKIITNRAVPFSLVISYIGFKDKKITITKSGSIGVVILAEDESLDEIIISASRVPEKKIESVASVTIINSKSVAAIPVNGDPMELLRNVQGVNIVRSGTQFSNIELRGVSSVNESNTLVLRDYAPLTTTVDKQINSAASALNALDVARVEVVRGPVGAIYGPNVTSGVVHFISKDPFKYPGIDFQIGSGERNSNNFAFRYAANNNKKFGWKLLTSISKTTDFSISDNELLDKNGNKVIVEKSFQTLGGKRFENISNTNQQLNNWFVETSFEYRATEKLKLNYSLSLSRALSNYRNQTSHLLNGDQRYEQQFRISSGNFFASVYHRHSFGNVDDNGNLNGLADHIFSFDYSSRPNFDSNGDGTLDTYTPGKIGAQDYYDFAMQYNMQANEDLKVSIGADAKISPSINGTIIYGLNSADAGGDNSYNIYGGYVSAKYKLSKKFAINATGRLDRYSAYKTTAFSPRIGLVFNPDKSTGFRFSYSKAFEGQSKIRTWLDFVIPTPGFFPETHVTGVGNQVTYNNPITRFPFGEIAGSDSFALQDIVNALATNAGVSIPSVNGTINSQLTSANFAGPGAAGLGVSTGNINGLSEVGQGELTLKSVNQIELGYSTTINNNLKINVDLYYSISSNFQPAGLVPLSAGSQLDLASVQAEIESQIPAGPDRTAIIASLYSFVNAPNPVFNSVPGYGLVLSDRAQKFGWDFDAGFPTFGNNNASNFGTEVSVSYNITPNLSSSVNYSYISKNVWQPEELGETNQNYQFFLNVPTNRLNLGISLLPNLGFYGTLNMNYQSNYEGKQGDGRVFTGVNNARTIFDGKIGYRAIIKNSSTKFDLGISIQNLFDEKYSHFVNLPEIRRFAMMSLKVSL